MAQKKLARAAGSLENPEPPSANQNMLCFIYRSERFVSLLQLHDEIAPIGLLNHLDDFNAAPVELT